MKHVIIIFLMFFGFAPMNAQLQDAQGIVTYNRKSDWIAIMSNLPYMTSEEIDRNRLTWGSYESDGTNYELYFKSNKSLYTYKKESSEGGYSWKKEKYIITRDLKKKTTDDLIEMLGKKYRIQDDVSRRRWKILNEIKEIEGYLCMKAETTDTIKGQTIHAWFTDKVPFFGGPEGYNGLPGLILEIDVNDGEVMITATDVNLEAAEVKLPYPKKMKGKEISYAEYHAKVDKYIKETIEGRKNPYWRIRY